MRKAEAAAARRRGEAEAAAREAEALEAALAARGVRVGEFADEACASRWSGRARGRGCGGTPSRTKLHWPLLVLYPEVGMLTLTLTLPLTLALALTLTLTLTRWA